MKKLSLKNLKLESKDLLRRDQLRSVFGGYGSGSGGYGSGTCGATDGVSTVCGISKYEAQQLAAIYEGNWCCESCAGNGGSASYC